MDINVIVPNSGFMSYGNGISLKKSGYSHQHMITSLRQEGLLDQGNVTTQSISDSDLINFTGKYAGLVLQHLKKDRLNIVPLTSYTSMHQITLMQAETIKANKEGYNVMIIGGGPHFVREDLKKNRRHFPDSIEACLDSDNEGYPFNVYDGVFHGGFDGFIELLRIVRDYGVDQTNGGCYIPKELPKGYYYIPDRSTGIIGSGISKVPHLDVAPFYVHRYKGGASLSFMFSNNCTNSCDFCSTSSKYNVDEAAIKKSIKLIKGSLGYGMINLLKLNDPNPFHPRNIDHTAHGLEIIASEFGFSPRKMAYFDSGLFRDPNTALKYIGEFDISNIFTGRDAVFEHGAEFIGTKYMGCVKTQEELNAEREGIKEVIKKLREKGSKHKVTISYVLTPIETTGSIDGIFDEMGYFFNQSSSNIEIVTQWGLLEPYPGTRVIRKHTDLVADRVFTGLSPNDLWDRDAILKGFPDSVFPTLENIFSKVLTEKGMIYNPETHQKVMEMMKN